MPAGSERQSILSLYFREYLLNIRKVSESTADHYLQALRTVSEMLVGERLVGTDIYEIQDLADLLNAADKITASQAFVELNTRGHQMYSAGLNHYLSFAKGDLFDTVSEHPELIDIPVDPSDSTESTGIGYRRSGIIRDQALSLAGHRCEIDRSHESFVAEASHKPYMEGYHILSMKLQTDFSVSLDVYANILCVCPLCHRRIHYGEKQDRVCMVRQLFDLRADRLHRSGICLSKEDFVDLAVRR